MLRHLSTQYERLVDLLRRPAAWVEAQRLAHEQGQGLVEYSLLLGLVVLVVIGIVGVLGGTVRDLWYQRIIDTFPG